MSSTSFKKTDYGKLVRFQIPSHARYISHTRNYFFHLCLENGFSLYDALDLKLVLGEALSNIVSHAYDGNANKPIFIREEISLENLIILPADFDG
ncbi:MAG: ATP-binding protein [Leptospira sp.]|nr:ATP-binding protein [Leptospira sp.]